MSEPLATRVLLTAEEFHARCAGERWELQEGEVVPMPPVSAPHSDVAGEVLVHLHTFVKARHLAPNRRVMPGGTGAVRRT